MMFGMTYDQIVNDYKGGDVDIKFDKLTEFKDCPQHITGYFACWMTPLTSLVGGPQRVDGKYLFSRTEVSSLDGCASYIGDTLNFQETKVSSLVGIHKIIKHCPEITFDGKNIIEGGIGMLLIDGLSCITAHTEPFYIIEKYLGSGAKGMMECSKELISRGYEAYAKL